MASSFDVEQQASKWAVASRAGEPRAVIHVQDLQSTTTAGTDAWGRTDKEQPLLISAELSLAQPFQHAAANDSVSDDTIHYGLLSKSILASLKASHQGLTLSGLTSRLLENVKYSNDKAIFTNAQLLRYSCLTLMLPKASLRGEGVSFSIRCASPPQAEEGNILWGFTLKLHQLRVATLIGVNANERLAKQMVIADIEIENHTTHLVPEDSKDGYVKYESIVVETMENSTFETLEALAITLAANLEAHLGLTETSLSPKRQIKISLEKPTAVPLAQAPKIEYTCSPEGY